MYGSNSATRLRFLAARAPELRLRCISGRWADVGAGSSSKARQPWVQLNLVRKASAAFETQSRSAPEAQFPNERRSPEAELEFSGARMPQQKASVSCCFHWQQSAGPLPAWHLIILREVNTKDLPTDQSTAQTDAEAVTKVLGTGRTWDIDDHGLEASPPGLSSSGQLAACVRQSRRGESNALPIV